MNHSAQNIHDDKKLMFSHVWEDSDLESSVLKSFHKKNSINTQLLMVCSGGDTLIHLLCNNYNDIRRLNMTINVLDNNPLQLAIFVTPQILIYI
jgi:S-adenosylmethionine:diacylglycerol 3-amino-3-carboxypropyl transferase